MESILKSDIFFFITSISICITTVILIISGYYIIKILKNIEKITEKLNNTVSKVEEDFSEIGKHITDSPLFSFIFGKKRKSKN